MLVHSMSCLFSICFAYRKSSVAPFAMNCQTVCIATYIPRVYSELYDSLTSEKLILGHRLMGQNVTLRNKWTVESNLKKIITNSFVSCTKEKNR